MNLARWFTNRTPGLMLRILRGGSQAYRAEHDRKLRLFVVACWRRVWDMLPDDDLRALVEAQEAFADGSIGEHDLWVIRSAIANGREVPSLVRSPEGVADRAFWLAHFGPAFNPEAMSNAASDLAGHRLRSVADADDESVRLAVRAEARIHSDLLRDIFGDIFRPPTVDPGWLSWNGGTVADLARAMYKERAFERMPILADALEDAGCDDIGLLLHCRGDSPHVRGCWALEALLGRR